MAKRAGRRKVNKAQAIRDVLNAKGPNTAPKEVMAELANKKISVSAAQVSNVKADLRRKSGGLSTNGRGKGGVTLESLLEAKQLADKLGGVDQAKRALDTLAKLR